MMSQHRTRLTCRVVVKVIMILTNLVTGTIIGFVFTRKKLRSILAAFVPFIHENLYFIVSEIHESIILKICIIIYDFSPW